MEDKVLERTAIGRDFFKYKRENKYQPSIDKFLDYRNALTKGTHKNYHAVPQPFIDLEIEATDEILKRLKFDSQ